MRKMLLLFLGLLASTQAQTIIQGKTTVNESTAVGSIAPQDVSIYVVLLLAVTMPVLSPTS